MALRRSRPRVFGACGAAALLVVSAARHRHRRHASSRSQRSLSVAHRPTVRPPQRRTALPAATSRSTPRCLREAAAVAEPVAAPATCAPVTVPTTLAGARASKKYGRLSISGDARAKDVFIDGKRMLGRGARSFTVICGPHTIAVGNRADAHDVDIPCGAELVVGK